MGCSKRRVEVRRGLLLGGGVVGDIRHRGVSVNSVKVVKKGRSVNMRLSNS